MQHKQLLEFRVISQFAPGDSKDRSVGDAAVADGAAGLVLSARAESKADPPTPTTTTTTTTKPKR